MTETIGEEVAGINWERSELPATLVRLWLRADVLENIADRLAATCADPVAVADYLAWKDQ